MTIFFHAQTLGFYDTRAHGERTLWVPDPTWERPQVNIPDPAWKADSENPDAQPPTVRIADVTAEPPLVEVVNPACCLPPAAELSQVSAQEYEALFSAQASGKVIAADGVRPVISAPPELTWEQRKLEITAAVQQFLDQTAKSAGYDDIKNAISYADEPAVQRFQAQGQAFRAWRSVCWAYCHEQFDAVEQKKRELFSPQSLVSELPQLSLPE
ncbi:hypothetical protein BFW87_17430 [Pseudomonas fluorescens]|uniref:Uncharacterized protein n=1 Tax=Pseudomonas fluorescens TaxID=294 RepID=A0A1T2YL50_PSEFL|nr:hypothetical protein [Pseudomonas fluorescens]OPA92393.1 hypothetical protein BFW87_17430 [Pseudomonas fluorescens]